MKNKDKLSKKEIKKILKDKSKTIKDEKVVLK